MRALVTRPRDDAQGISAELRARGYEVVVEPLLDIVALPGVTVPAEGVQAILATSANGVRMLADRLADRSLPLYAVGDATAAAARRLGYARVESAGGDVDSLAALVRDRVDPAAGALLHAAGTAVAGDLSGLLAASGHQVRRVVLYEARAAQAISPATLSLLSANAIDIALFFSPRTAQTFATLLTSVGAAGGCRQVVAYCLSAAVARALAVLPWAALRVAERPEQRALLNDVDVHGPSPAVVAEGQP